MGTITIMTTTRIMMMTTMSTNMRMGMVVTMPTT